MERRQLVQVLRIARLRLVRLLQPHPHHEQFQSKSIRVIVSSVRVGIETRFNIVYFYCTYGWYTSILPKTSETPRDQ